MASGGASSVEVYGFSLWLASWLGYWLYLAWVLLPEHVLHSLGIYYYPSKYWAVAFPAWFLVAAFSSVFLYESMNMCDVKPCTSRTTVSDPVSRWVGDATDMSLALTSSAQHIPPIMHLPPTFVSQTLYSPKPAAQ